MHAYGDGGHELSFWVSSAVCFRSSLRGAVFFDLTAAITYGDEHGVKSMTHPGSLVGTEFL